LFAGYDENSAVTSRRLVRRKTRSTVATPASGTQAVADVAVSSNDIANRRDPPSRPCATSTRHACAIGRKIG
jgi:hypothetical protein